jgi:hypothetical protein
MEAVDEDRRRPIARDLLETGGYSCYERKIIYIYEFKRQSTF